jgi:Ribonuclease G/E
VCHEILREVSRQARLHPTGDLIVSAMPEVAARLAEHDAAHVEALEQRLGRPVVVEARGDLHQEVYQVLVRTPGGRA